MKRILYISVVALLALVSCSDTFDIPEDGHCVEVTNIKVVSMCALQVQTDVFTLESMFCDGLKDYYQYHNSEVPFHYGAQSFVNEAPIGSGVKADMSNLALVVDMSNTWDVVSKKKYDCLKKDNYQTLVDKNLPSAENYLKLFKEISPSGSWVGEWHAFFGHAGVRAVRVVADKPLFGRVAGAELNDKFQVVYCPPLLAEFPSYDIVKGVDDEAPRLLSDMCAKPVVLPIFDIAVKFADVPAEKYDEVTFTVSMDILLPDGGERTLTGSVKVAFE